MLQRRVLFIVYVMENAELWGSHFLTQKWGEAYPLSIYGPFLKFVTYLSTFKFNVLNQETSFLQAGLSDDF